MKEAWLAAQAETRRPQTIVDDAVRHGLRAMQAHSARRRELDAEVVKSAEHAVTLCRGTYAWAVYKALAAAFRHRAGEGEAGDGHD